MLNKLMSTISMAAMPSVIICGVLATGCAALAGEEGHCSNATLSGDYGFAIEGVILAVPGVPALPPGGLLFRGVTMTHFDGKGGFTQVDHDVLNGEPQAEDWAPLSGTYSINRDCTGTMVINQAGNPLSPVNLHLVVVKHGTEIHTVVDVNAVTSVGIKVD
jgi:hypothetical protein